MAFINANFLAMRDINGKDLGTMATGKAKEYARTRGLELVAVDESADPPIYTVQQRQRFVPKNDMDEAKTQYKITASSVRLKDENGNSLGVVSTSVALKMAEERGLDLIAENNRIDPPIGRLGNLSKYIYEQKKKAKEMDKKNRAAAKASEEKTLRLTSDKTDSAKADRVRIIKQANEFLAEGHPVKINIRFRGREISHAEEAMECLRDEILHGITSGTIAKESRSVDGGTYSIQCSPSKKK